MFTALVVGAGNIAGGFDTNRSDDDWPLSHAGAYTRHGNFRVEACVEPDPVRRLSFMKRWGARTGFASIQDAISSGQRYDVVSICSPTQSHESDVLAATALSPRLIFCEKPVTPRLESTVAVGAQCAAANIPLVVNYSRRWDPVLRRYAEEMARGEWGTLRTISAFYTKGLNNNGSHLFDLLNLVVGPIEPVWVGQPIVDMWLADPSVPAVFLTESNVSIAISCGHAADFARFEVEFLLARGSIAMENGGQVWRVRRPVDDSVFPGYRTLGPDELVHGGLEQTMAAAVDEISRHLSSGAPLSSTAANAISAQKACESILDLLAMNDQSENRGME